MTVRNGILKACEEWLQDEVVSQEDLTLRADPGKTLFRVRFARGRQLKVAISEKYTPSRREELAGNLRRIAHRAFPLIVLHGPQWIATEWFLGQPLSVGDCSVGMIDRAADLLVALHEVPLESTPDTSRVALAVGEKVSRGLSILVERRVLAPKDADRVVALFEGGCMGEGSTRLIHGDFSPQNLIVHDGELRSIDNELIGPHFREYDLSRAWTMWEDCGLPADRLVERYSRQSPNAPNSGALHLWGVVDLVLRISYALSLGVEPSSRWRTKLLDLLADGHGTRPR